MSRASLKQLHGHALHDRAVEHVAAVLRDHGCTVAYLPRRGGLTLTATRPHHPTVVVAVRVSQLKVRQKPIRAHGRTYVYRVPMHQWNLHVHGRRFAHPDVWCLVPADDVAGVLIVPDAVIATQMNVSLTAGTARGWSKLRPYTGRWELIVGARRRAA